MSAAADHAKHLRMIHFSLVVASIVIVISTVLGRSDIYTRALAERMAISDEFDGAIIQDIYDNIVARAVETSQHGEAIATVHKMFSGESIAVARRIADHNPDLKNPLFPNLEVVPIRLIWSLEFNSNYWSSAVGIFPQSAVHPSDEYSLPEDYYAISSLDDFRYVWDNLSNIRTFHAITHLMGERATIRTGAYPLSPSIASRPMRATEVLRKVEESPFPVSIEIWSWTTEDRQMWADPENFAERGRIDNRRPPPKKSSPEKLDLNDPVYGPYELLIQIKQTDRSSDSQQNLVIPLVHAALQIDGQAYLIEKLGGATWKHGTFEEVFPALSVVMKDLMGVSLEDIEPFLRRQIKFSGDRFSLFGIQAPAALINTWGGAILAAIVIYLWVHLRAFARRNRKTRFDDFAWIGLYDDPLAKMLFLVSAVLLPAGVAIWLAYQTITGTAGFEFSHLVPALLVVAGAVGVMHAILPLWRGAKSG